MSRWSIQTLLILTCLLALTYPAPAPLTYRAGEGWTYEPVGAKGDWQRSRAKDQLEVATAAFEKKNYNLALRAARRTVSMWPQSDYAAEAQFLVGRCYQGKNKDEKAFKEYQKLLDKYPKFKDREGVLKEQYEIANKFLGGKWFSLWGIVPLYPSMEKTADMYEKVIKSGPYSEVAPQAQLKMGAAQEKRKDYPAAVKAYERAADRYADRKPVAADALFKAGMAYYKQAKTAEYDQNAAAQAIATFNDFIALYPGETRVPKAQELIVSLKTEQARGAYTIARYYEKRHRWSGALVYYNEVLLKDPNSQYATEARQRIDVLKKKSGVDVQPTTAEKPAEKLVTPTPAQ